MSVRSALLSLVLACGAAACGGVAMDDATAAPLPGARVETARLRIVGDAELDVVAGTETPLKVRYLDLNDAPVAHEVVQFGVVGTAEGASLDHAQVTTDADGYAETKLAAGTAVSAFQVRASAEGAAPVYIEVHVVEAARPSLTLGVSYDGARSIDSRRVSVVDNMKCEQLLSDGADGIKVSYVLRSADQIMAYPDALGAGRKYAALAWGSDETNSTLARGCVDFVAPVASDAQGAALQVIVPLKNLPLRLMDQYEVSLTLDVSGPLSALASRSRALVQAALPMTSTAEASYLLDQLVAAKPEVAAVRASVGLDALLANALKANQSGPLRWVDSLTSAIVDEGATCSVEAQLSPAHDSAPSRFEVTRVVSLRGGKTAREIDLSAVPVRGAADLRASYDDARALLDVASLRVPLGFGSYAVDLLDAAQELNTSEMVARPALSGCTELAQLVAQTPALSGISSSAVLDVCAAAVQKLVSSVRADWANLDQTRAAFQLSGAIFVHDRTGDGQVDDLGPSTLRGSWGSADASAETALDATLRVTPKTLLAL